MFKIFNNYVKFDQRFKIISTIIVKVTHRCNLDCLYCYENITKKGEDMSVETFCQLVDLVLENSEKECITFLFHGGEPTLLSKAWYEECIEYALKKASSHGKRVNFSMQTNLLGINESKIILFKKYNIQLGISLDGPAMLQSSMRGSEDKVFMNFKRLQSENIHAGVLMTINESNYEHFSTICHWLVNEAEVKSFKANVVTPVGRGFDLEPLSAEKIFAAQYSILEYMIATEGCELQENNLNIEILRFFADDPREIKRLRSTLCNEKLCGAGSEVLGVTPDGNLLPCGRFTWDNSEYYLGSLYDVKVENKSYQKAFRKKVECFHRLIPKTWYDCDNCAASKTCGFGCQAFIVRSKKQANVDCFPTKMRYQFYKENRKRLKPVYENIIKRNKSSFERVIEFKIKNPDGSYKTYSI